jgi:Fe2+ or Zn2+ uptake regulation protein
MAEGGRQGRRATAQLALVLDAVRRSGNEHPTAEWVYARVRRVLPSISLGTVYRNLQRLVEEGRIGAAHLGARSLRYDPTPTSHDHLLCEHCGRVIDLPADASAALLEAVGRSGHEVTSHALLVFGRCRACREPV